MLPSRCASPIISQPETKSLVGVLGAIKSLVNMVKEHMTHGGQQGEKNHRETKEMWLSNSREWDPLNLQELHIP